MVRTSMWTQQDQEGQSTMLPASADLFAVLGLGRSATEVEVRRAFKTLVTKEHPDKGGDPERFKLIKLAYDTLSNKGKREHYEATGRIARSAAENFMDEFRQGSFEKYSASRAQEKKDLSEALTIARKPDQSHSSGFEAWMRGRGEQGTAVFTAETMAKQFGVNKGSYDPVPLPNADACKAVCQKAGSVTEVVKVCSEPLPAALEWGQVLISMKYAPIDAADVYTCTMGGTYGNTSVSPPFVAGHHGIGLVTKVGPGVKNLREGEWVIPGKSHLGTWQSLAVLKGSDLVAVPTECMPLEYAALSQQLCLAYRLLEDFGKLKPGDAVILNASTSIVGQVTIQLCYVLQLRCIAVVHGHSSFDKTALWLKSLGATEVVADAGSVKADLERLRFFAKPKLALDAVGGSSAMRIADALAEGGQVVIYGCLSGKSPQWPWQSWILKGLQVHGFSYASWMAKNLSKVPKMMNALGALVKSEQLRLAVTEYNLASEMEEAMEHALDRGTNTKVLLRMPDDNVSE